MRGANSAANDQQDPAVPTSREPQAPAVDSAAWDSAEWASVMADVARELQEHHDDVDDTFSTVTAAAVSVIPGIDFACVTVASKALGVTSKGATDPAAERINEIQQALGEGPCLTALWTAPLVRVDNTSSESPWPAYSLAATQLGIPESLSVRLYVKDQVLGALSLYSRSAGSITDESVEAANLFAAHAAVALFAAELQANLTVAIDRRDMIGQAKGILMERYKLTDGQAFALLVKVSQNTNTPIRDVAAKLTETGDIAGLPAEQPPASP